MTNRERVLEFLCSIAPADASNGEIVARTGVKPHTQVFIITRELMQAGRIKGLQAGHEWRFWVGDAGRVSPSSLSRSDGILLAGKDDPYEWDGTQTSECRLSMTWIPIGRIILSGNKIIVPSAPSVPAIYRFRIRKDSTGAAYIGETENLARRLTLYANPGPSQQTNLRLNAQFREALAASAEVGVSAVYEGAWIERVGTRIAADFSEKAVRCLFENAAIAEGLGSAITSLNL